MSRVDTESPEHVTRLTKAMRRRAAAFYYKPTMPNYVDDWIEGRDAGIEVDEDVRDLATLLEEVWSNGLHATLGESSCLKK